jgi:hypothetical protein
MGHDNPMALFKKIYNMLCRSPAVPDLIGNVAFFSLSGDRVSAQSNNDEDFQTPESGLCVKRKWRGEKNPPRNNL